MSEPFDPYRKWLGIPPEEQPPDHYRLLAISPFESDPDVIAHAADQRMAHVKNFSAGPHSQLSQKILNELAAARVCLLNEQTKAAYDAQLRKSLADRSVSAPALAAKAPLAKAAPPVRLPAARALQETPAVARPVTMEAAAPEAASSNHGRARADSMARPGYKARRKRPNWLLASGIIGFLLIVGLVVVLTAPGPPPRRGGSQASRGPAQPGPDGPKKTGGPTATGSIGSSTPDAKASTTPATPTTNPADPVEPPPALPVAEPKTADVAALWIFDKLDRTAVYEVLGTWEPEPTASRAAGYTFFDGPQEIGRGQADQTRAPADGESQGAHWQRLGRARSTTGVLTVQLVPSRDGLVIADGVAVVKVVAGQQELAGAAHDNGARGYAEKGEGWQDWPAPTGWRQRPRFHAPEGATAVAVEPPATTVTEPPATTTKPPATTTGPPATAATEPPKAKPKLPEPDAAARRKSEGEVNELYKASIANATDLRSKLSLADELLKVARGTKNDPPGQFVLFEKAAGLLADVAQVPRAMATADELGEIYDTDVLALKTDLLRKSADVVLPRVVSAGIYHDLLAACESLAEQAIAAGRLDTADDLLKVAVSAARKTGDKRLVSLIQSRSRDIEVLRPRLEEFRQAEAALAARPDDPHANGVTGVWHCFVRGDWDKGLPCLAKGDDATLAGLAGREMADPQDADQLKTLGDDWLAVAQSKRGIEQIRIQSHAVDIYRRALPKLTGLARAALEKKLEEAGINIVPYALKFDGATSCVLVRNFAYAGQGPITVEAICKPLSGEGSRAASSAYQTVLANSSSSTGVALVSSGHYWYFRFYFQPAIGVSSSPYVYSTVTPQAGKWVHLAGVYDGKTISLYVDGALMRSQASGVHAPGTLPLVIGAAPVDPRSSSGPFRDYFEGLIRGVRISNRARYTEAFTPPTELTPDASTVLCLWFDQGKGNQIFDASGRIVLAEIHRAEWVKVDPKELTPTDAAASDTPAPGAGFVPHLPDRPPQP